MFGSIAKELNKDDSDIDVFVKTQTSNPFVIIEIKDRLEEILKRKVDIIRLRENMNPLLKQKIESEGKYV